LGLFRFDCSDPFRSGCSNIRGISNVGAAAVVELNIDGSAARNLCGTQPRARSAS
jgi:hypothetical protein